MNLKWIRRYLINQLITAIIFFSLFINLSGSLIKTVDEYANFTSERIEVNISSNEYNTNTIKLTHIDALKERYNQCQVSYARQLPLQLKNENRIYPVEAVLTDDIQIQFLNISMIEGSFFQKKDSEFGLNAIVISDNLSVDLFSTYNSVGYEVEMLDNIYTIIGVYKSENSILAFLNTDGKERVYIPFKSVPGHNEICIHNVVVKGESIKNDTFRVIKMHEELSKIINVPLSGYRINDFYSKKIVISQLRDILIFIITLVSYILLVKFGFRYMNKNISIIKNSFREHYFSGIIKSQAFTISKILMVPLLLYILCFIIFRYATPHVYIPQEFIPYDNILDFDFYIQQIKMIVISNNQNIGYIPSQFEMFSSTAVILSIILVLLSIISLVILVRCIKVSIILEIDMGEYIRYFILALTIGNILSILLCMLFTMTIKISVYIFIILIIYLINITYFAKLKYIEKAELE